MKDENRTPLRTVLINFLNHIETLESEQYPEKSYDSEFQDLKLFSESVKGLKQYSCIEGEKEFNKKKNRYKDILPFDLSRVILNEYAGIPGSDYINANYIKGASGSIAYIASQGPLSNTVIDFWRMVVQCEVQVIVMACNEEEAGKVKCEKYWVDDGEEKQFGMVSVKLLKASTVCPDFSVRTMRLKYTNNFSVIEERTVCQLHYVAWPDHGVPTVVHPLLEMVKLVRDTQASETLPVLIHCSAGCGRTGTICAIDYVWGLLRTGKLTTNFSLLELVREMRRQRISMVQTKEQYVLVHQAVRELFKEQLNMIDSHPYENVDSNGIIREKNEPIYDTVGVSLFSVNDKEEEVLRKQNIFPVLQKNHLVTIRNQNKNAESPSTPQKLQLTQISLENVSDPIKVDKIKCQFEKPNLKQNECTKASFVKYKEPEERKICDRNLMQSSHGKSSPSFTLVKRSKSLKILSHEERKSLSIYNEVPLEVKRRPSLESNVDDRPNDFHNIGSEKRSLNKLKDFGHVCQIVKDYEALSGNKKFLDRSYTTFDMLPRQVLHSKSHTGLNISFNCESELLMNKYKLARSQTQLDFKKIYHVTPSSDFMNKEKKGPTSKFPDYEIIGNEKKTRRKKLIPDAECVLITSSEKIGKGSHSVEQNQQSRFVANIESKVKNLNAKKQTLSNKILCKGSLSPNKGRTNKNSTFRIQSESSSSSTDSPSVSLDGYFCVNNDLVSIKNNHTVSQCCIGSNFHKYDFNSKFANSFQNKKETASPMRGDLKEPIYINTTPNVISKNNFNKPTCPVKFKEVEVTRGLVVNVSDNTDNMKVHGKLLRDNSTVYSPGISSSIQLNGITRTDYHPKFSRDSNKNCHVNGSSNVPHGKMKGNDSCLLYDASLIKKNGEELRTVSLGNGTCNTPLKRKTHLGLKLKYGFHDDQAVGSNIGNIPTVKRHTSVILPRPGNKDDSELRSYGPLNNWEGEQQWHSAPGVDIDKVAASISQKDGNKNKLIRTALEALNLRKPKLGSSPLQGVKPIDKSRRQQYL